MCEGYFGNFRSGCCLIVRLTNNSLEMAILPAYVFPFPNGEKTAISISFIFLQSTFRTKFETGSAAGLPDMFSRGDDAGALFTIWALQKSGQTLYRSPLQYSSSSNVLGIYPSLTAVQNIMYLPCRRRHLMVPSSHHGESSRNRTRRSGRNRARGPRKASLLKTARIPHHCCRHRYCHFYRSCPMLPRKA